MSCWLDATDSGTCPWNARFFFSVPTAKTTPSVASEKDDVCIFFFWGVQNVAGGKVSFQWHGRVVDDS